ncbi:MAG: hypothetical protein LAO22_04685 [Acidobacteriia bacterium]|nr:hypothetical protein [Terriglobia bacterium]
MNSLKFTLPLLLCFVSNTFAQVEATHGTIVVALLSQNEVVVAADSRKLGTFGNFTLYPDDACKVAVLDNNILYAQAGTTNAACNIAGSSCYWDSMLMARELVRSRDAIHANSNALALSNAWNKRAYEALWAYYFFRPKRAAMDADLPPIFSPGIMRLSPGLGSLTHLS